MTGLDFILGVTVLPAAVIGWAEAVRRYEARQARIRDCIHSFYEEEIPHLRCWKRLCHNCPYQEDITNEKRREERG